MRFALDILKKLGPNFAKAFPATINGVKLPGRGIAGSVLPDVGFGFMTGMMTPGDLGDKLIAGTTDAVIGAGLTGGARGLVGARPGSALGTLIEYGGGMGSGMLSMPVSDELLRIKGGGQSPYDKLQMEQYAGIREQVKQELYDQMIAGRGASAMLSDPFSSGYGMS